MNLSRLLVAVLLVSGLLGCGAPKPAAPADADTTAACCDSATRARCTGSDSAGAVCEDVLDTAAKGPAQPHTATEEPRPASATEKPAALPGMWDFGSEKCIPCKTMKEIIDPMIADYKGKVDIRIINVYEEKELTKQFRIVTIPTQVFIDAQGKELFRHIGVYPRDSMEACFARFGFPVVQGKDIPKLSQPARGT